jgi:hypothetical protein
MELRAIIGKKTGKMGDYNSGRIVSHLSTIGTLFHEYNGYNTNVTKLIDFYIIEEELKRKDYPGKGENLYIHVSNLIDPQDFYHYLSQNGFVLRDSKINL